MRSFAVAKYDVVDASVAVCGVAKRNCSVVLSLYELVFAGVEKDNERVRVWW